MKLKQPEIIQILRKRANLNQGAFGAKAFDTSFESGRTKVKNIELGKQKPSAADLKKMARVLAVPVEELIPDSPSHQGPGPKPADGVVVLAQVLDLFPGVGPYLEMLNKAVTLDDEELIEHIIYKIEQLFRKRVSASRDAVPAAAPGRG